MKKIKLVYKQMVGLMICVVLFFLENKTLIFGKIYNNFFPCICDYAHQFNSAPCYLNIDLGVMVLVIILGLFLLGWIMVRIFKSE